MSDLLFHTINTADHDTAVATLNQAIDRADSEEEKLYLRAMRDVGLAWFQFITEYITSSEDDDVRPRIADAMVVSQKLAVAILSNLIIKHTAEESFDGVAMRMHLALGHHLIATMDGAKDGRAQDALDKHGKAIAEAKADPDPFRLKKLH